MAVRAITQEHIISRLEELPTLPAIVYELNQVIADPMSSTKDVEKIMENDQSLTAKVLKLVNSAYYAIPGGVSNLARAIAYIGFDTVHQLVLSASIIEALEVKGPSEFDMNAFWQHSVGVGIAAETIAKMTGHPMPSDVFTCGLVHDMGKVAMYTLDKEIVKSITQRAQSKNITFLEAEQELAIPKHTEVGRLLAEKWLLPKQIQVVIKHHHQKETKLRGDISADLNRTVDIVLIANLLIHALQFGNSGYDKIPGAPREVLERLRLDPNAGFKNLLKEIKESLERASDFISVLGS